VVAFFDREFVKTGALPRQLSKALHLGFERRSSNDYGEVWTVDADEAKTTIAEALNFVNAIEQFIQSDLMSSK
jgi:uncharacterized protein (UPF0332 family)